MKGEIDRDFYCSAGYFDKAEGGICKDPCGIGINAGYRVCFTSINGQRRISTKKNTARSTRKQGQSIPVPGRHKEKLGTGIVLFWV